MSGQGNSRWGFAVLALVVSITILPRLIAAYFPLVTPSAMLVVAAALLVTIVAVGVHAWRSARVDNA